jgi:hypothetical protein
LSILKAEKHRLEASIAAARNFPQEGLAQKLIALKLKRPDLFALSGIEQIAIIVKAILK